MAQRFTCFLVHGSFPDQGSNPCFCFGKQTLPLSHQRSPVCVFARLSVMADSLRPMDCGPPGSPVYEHSAGKNTGVGCHALLQGDLPNPGIELWSPALQVDSLWSEPPGMPLDIIFKIFHSLSVIE